MASLKSSSPGRSARQVKEGTVALKRWTGLLGPSRQRMRPSVSRANKIGEFQNEKKEFDKSPPEVKDVNFQSLEIDQRHKNQWRNTGRLPLDPSTNNGGYYPGVPSPPGWRLSTRETGPPPLQLLGEWRRKRILGDTPDSSSHWPKPGAASLQPEACWEERVPLPESSVI